MKLPENPESEDSMFVELDDVITAMIRSASSDTGNFSPKENKQMAHAISLKLFKIQWNICTALMGPLLASCQLLKSDATKEKLTSEFLKMVSLTKPDPIIAKDPYMMKKFQELREKQDQICIAYVEFLFKLNEAAKSAVIPNPSAQN